MTGTRRTDLLLLVTVLLVAFCAWLLGAGHPSAAAATSTAPDRAREGVLVSGVGQVSGAPDVLRLELGAEARKPTVDAALADASAAMAHVRDALLAGGVAKADLQTTGVDISPTYDPKGRSITGYVVTQRLSAKVRNLDSAGALITKAVAAGGDATRLNGVSFALDDDDALLAKARRAAFDAAEAKAQLYADAAGRGLGAVVSVNETVAAPPVGYDAGYAQAASAPMPVPLERGQQQVSVTVTVEWRFR